MGKIHLEISSSLNSCLSYLRAYSWYNKETGERVINKSDASVRKISENVVGRSKSSVGTDLKNLKEQGIVIERGKQYIIKEPKGSYIELPEEFVKQMLKTFNADTINIYNWLYRRWKYCGKNNKPCLFSYGDLAEEAMGKCNNDRNRKQAQHNLAQLVLNGLIAYRIVRIGKTYLRMLEYIKTEFVMIDTFDLYEQEIIKDGEECTNKTESLIEKIDFEKIEDVSRLGLPEEASAEKILPKLFFKEANLFEYKAIEEIFPKAKNKNHLRQELKWLENKDPRNKDYVEYELERLDGKD